MNTQLQERVAAIAESLHCRDEGIQRMLDQVREQRAFVEVLISGTQRTLDAALEATGSVLQDRQKEYDAVFAALPSFSETQEKIISAFEEAQAFVAEHQKQIADALAATAILSKKAEITGAIESAASFVREHQERIEAVYAWSALQEEKYYSPILTFLEQTNSYTYAHRDSAIFPFDFVESSVFWTSIIPFKESVTGYSFENFFEKIKRDGLELGNLIAVKLKSINKDGENDLYWKKPEIDKGAKLARDWISLSSSIPLN